MDTEKIEITLNSANNSSVDLDNMSIEALESFLSVTTALKNIAESVTKDISFTIQKGSAYASVNGKTYDIQNIYSKIDEAINGESEDEIITSNLRNIQKQIQNEAFTYQFSFSNINIEEKIKSAKKIAKKRVRNLYQNQVTILSGKFNEVGGNDPNYHFEYGNGVKKTVDCTIEQAIELKEYLYQTISCLVQKKYTSDDIDNVTYQHCAVIKNNQIQTFRKFINDLNNTQDLICKLDLIYDFADNSNERIDDFIVLLKSYKYLFSDVNEYKTLLILTKNFDNNNVIKELRGRLLVDFDALMKTN